MTKMNLSWVTVSDLDKAIDFYTNVVGLKLSEKHEMFGWAEMVGSEGGARLGLAVMADENLKPGSNAVVTVTVADIAAATEEMKSKGCQIVGDAIDVPGIARLQLFVDTDGNLMQLHQNLEQ